MRNVRNPGSAPFSGSANPLLNVEQKREAEGQYEPTERKEIEEVELEEGGKTIGARQGQRYPCPAVLLGDLMKSSGMAPKGIISCRTEGNLHASARQSALPSKE